MKTDQTETYAGFWRRAAAFALDYVIILGYLILLTAVFALLTLLFDAGKMFADRILAQVLGFLTVTLPVTLYFALGESSPSQATWGKRRLGLRVGDERGNRTAFWQALLRSGLKFVPWEIAHTLIWQIRFMPQTSPQIINIGFALVYLLIGLNILLLVLTKKHQTLYDFLAQTCVTGSVESRS